MNPVASISALCGLLAIAASASADPPSPYLPPPRLTLPPLAQLVAPLFASSEPTGPAGDLAPSPAFEPLKLSLTSTIFPAAGEFPQCATLGDDVGNSVHGIPVQRLRFVRLAPRLTLDLFSSNGCPIDGGLGAGITYSVPLQASLWLVAGAGTYGVPGRGPDFPARTAADLRLDVVKQTQSGQTFHFGIEHKRGTGMTGVPGVATFGGGF